MKNDEFDYAIQCPVITITCSFFFIVTKPTDVISVIVDLNKVIFNLLHHNYNMTVEGFVNASKNSLLNDDKLKLLLCAYLN